MFLFTVLLLAVPSFAAPVDSAVWIGERERAPLARFLRFRCPFEGTAEPLRLSLSADQRYVLLLDGKVVSRGPAFGDLNEWHSQALELRPGPGAHLMEAVVWGLGSNGFRGDRPSAQLTWRTAFVLKAEGAYDARLTTGTARWQVGVIRGTAPDGFAAGGEAFGVGCRFKVRGTSFLDERPDAWTEAVAVDKTDPPPSYPFGGLRAPGWHVKPSLLPEQLHREIRPGETPAAFTVSARSRVEKIFDLGNFYCAYPQLAVKGGKGAKVTWSWTEALRDPTIADAFSWSGAVDKISCSKTDRARREGMVFDEKYAVIDTFLCDGRSAARFTTPWWRCGRWCRLVVETADEPLSVTDVALDETRYPLEVESSFASDDPSLEPIERMSVRGVEMCAHEIMYDCPFWEQQMYPGDCRVSFLAMLALTRDDRLMRQGLGLFDGARRPDGSIPMNWPSNHDQHSATWTLCWVMSVGDQALWRDDADWLKARLPGLEHTMLGMGRHENARGLLQDVPGWNYLDWVLDWRNESFAPPGAGYGRGESSVLNLLYLYAMRATERSLAACGDEARAAFWRAKAAKLSETLQAVFWDEARGCLADTPAKDRFSEHAQALGIVTDCLAGDRAKRAFAAMERGEGLAQASSFCLHYVFEACGRMGRGDFLLGKLGCWRQYVAMNMNCPLESLVFPRSDCHGFGAHPLFHFHSVLAGVTPSAPFFATVRVAPSPGPLRRIRAKTPHPRGFVVTKLDFDDAGGVRGEVTLPPGVTGTFVWAGRDIPLAPGANRID